MIMRKDAMKWCFVVASTSASQGLTIFINKNLDEFQRYIVPFAG